MYRFLFTINRVTHCSSQVVVDGRGQGRHSALVGKFSLKLYEKTQLAPDSMIEVHMRYFMFCCVKNYLPAHRTDSHCIVVTKHLRSNLLSEHMRACPTNCQSVTFCFILHHRLAYRMTHQNSKNLPMTSIWDIPPSNLGSK